MLFTGNSVLKMLDKGRSFLLYRPLSRQITYFFVKKNLKAKTNLFSCKNNRKICYKDIQYGRCQCNTSLA